MEKPHGTKRSNVSTACDSCRKKRSRCDGAKPICRACASNGHSCQYNLNSDRRKPFTKDVVQAMQLRIDQLELELAQLYVREETAERKLATGEQFYAAPAVDGTKMPLDCFQGGLALNSHGELRFYGPTSAYRAVVAENFSATALESARAWSLTRAPIPGSSPQDPILPQRPPFLDLAFQERILRNAFEYCYAGFGFVQEEEFMRDYRSQPLERTQYYSPFLLNVTLAIGCRYVDPASDFDRRICSDPADPATRGDVYANWARYLIDQEWYNPSIATIRALSCLGVYLAGRALDGPSWQFLKQAMCLAEDFGIHLGLHRLQIGSGIISDDLVHTRKHAFYSAFLIDIQLSVIIGRSPSFSPDTIDQTPPDVSLLADLVEPLHQSSAFHWACKLGMIASSMTSTLYALKPNLSMARRQAAVPQLNLDLESWYRELPAPLKAATSVSSQAPQPFIIGMNLFFFTIMIQVHRPFFRRTAAGGAISLSTDKCLSSSRHIVRLMKLQKAAHGLQKVSPFFQHAAFCCGTILALSATENGISSGNGETDKERRAQAWKDLRFVVESLQEVGTIWTTAITSSNVLGELLNSWNESPLIESDAELQDFWASLLMPPTTDTSNYGLLFPSIFPSWGLDASPPSMDGSSTSFDAEWPLFNPALPVMSNIQSPLGSENPLEDYLVLNS